ncbi:MAG: glycosyltransferase family 4 protein [Cytophagales bacterium]|jgi:glycosyltransferase involved in cell wall biosynthesis|nr:glycosyltransferase family 4 protein [Cytophagales bacterium]MCA6389626.1 glycosyltransferase family 4 protein [Cytophagales bacterium]MCA6389753.1 glycosyltransferase family 4 protein [Cytophagales bacterium]MCA6393725.1 glycosyltransferase family 4 protein [Cytophagales bacterium]MCA6397809.1 glycosyltransferase family 4 protein [Cytophagales bacterium]
MKILHIIDSLGIGGAEVLLRETLPLLPEYEHTICYLRKPDDLYQALSKHPIYFLDYNTKHSFYRTLKRLRKVIKLIKPEIIHSHLFLSTILCRLAILFTKTKLVTTIHGQLGIDPFNKSTLSLIAERLTTSACHSIICVSKFVLNDYDLYIKKRAKRYVLFNFVNNSFFDHGRTNTISPIVHPLRIVAIGSLKNEKNYFYLLKASENLNDVTIMIDIYGDGPERERLQNLINEKRLSVSLKGTTKDILNVLARSHLYVICSLSEGCPLALLEAMAAGMPILASDIPIFREVLEDSALYFDLDTPEDLANKIKMIASGQVDIMQLGYKSYKRALEIATSDKYIRQLKEIYSELLAKPE